MDDFPTGTINPETQISIPVSSAMKPSSGNEGILSEGDKGPRRGGKGAAREDKDSKLPPLLLFLEGEKKEGRKGRQEEDRRDGGKKITDVSKDEKLEPLYTVGIRVKQCSHFGKQ